MKRFIVCLIGLVGLIGSSALAIDSTPVGTSAGDWQGDRQDYCEAPGVVKWFQMPNNTNGWANSYCFGGTTGHLVADQFVGDGNSIAGVGWWQIFFSGIPTSPNFVIEIYAVGSNGCPTGAPLFSEVFTTVTIGPPTGMSFDDRECWVDFAENGYAPFAKADGVTYAIAINNNNCPGAGDSCFWSTATGLDSQPCCGKSADFGYPDWTPSTSALGLYFDQAFYLCNGEGGTPVEQSTWSAVKSTYK
jgi:hypothetical protein